ncbi:MAG: NAD(P)H-dependent dehydrogenase/reductase [Spirochaetaceae bacterium]|nr:MAG: NAD(P)H-dependent dehydrogenase/reductase [Spirochaetaceae bacterium]
MLELLQRRRSIRQYVAGQPVAEETINRLKETALRVPSSRSLNPWQYIFVSDQAVLKKLAGCKEHGSGMLANAALAIVVAADPEASDVWIEDASIAAWSLQVEAEKAGLGTCWVQLRNRKSSTDLGSQEYVADLLDIPENIQLLAIISIGHPATELPAHPAESLQWNKIHEGKWQSVSNE